MSAFYSTDPTPDPGGISACLSFSQCTSQAAHTVEAFIISNHPIRLGFSTQSHVCLLPVSLSSLNDDWTKSNHATTLTICTGPFLMGVNPAMVQLDFHKSWGMPDAPDAPRIPECLTFLMDYSSFVSPNGFWLYIIIFLVCLSFLSSLFHSVSVLSCLQHCM